MSAFIDVIMSMIFGSTMFMIVLGANDIASETQTVYSNDMLVQEMLTGTVQILEGEFRNMGYGLGQLQSTILYADSGRISFLSDLGRDGGTIDTITYSVGDTTQLLDTQNEMDRFLFRRVNSEPTLRVGVVTVFRLTYFTQPGELLPTPVPSDQRSEIYSVEVTIEVQNPYAPYRHQDMVQSGERTALYSSSLWQQTRLASQNLRR
jgi:hypothetical protein